MSLMSTSIINEYVKIGKESKIWHFCNAYGTEKEPIVLGDNTQIGSYTEIRPGATIGNSCRIQNGCFIAEKTIINNHVFIRFHICPNNVIHLRTNLYMLMQLVKKRSLI